MRRSARIAAAAAALTLCGIAAPALGGQGASQSCDDATSPDNEVTVLNNPITLGVEVGLVGGDTYLQVCYSTTSYGSGAPSVTGGWLFARTNDGEASCVPDSNPNVVRLNCLVDDPDTAGPGNTVTVTIAFQETTGDTGTLGAELGTPDTTSGQVCLRGFTVYGPTGTLGPFNLGACI